MAIGGEEFVFGKLNARSGQTGGGPGGRAASKRKFDGLRSIFLLRRWQGIVKDVPLIGEDRRAIKDVSRSLVPSQDQSDRVCLNMPPIRLGPDNADDCKRAGKAAMSCRPLT